MKIIFIFLALSFNALAFTEISLAQKHMLNDIEHISNVFEINYGPLAWKSEQFGWDLEFEKAKVKNAVLENPYCTIKQFQQIIKKFCLSLKDYHVVPYFFSTEHSFLPFNIQKIRDKFLVSYVYQEANIPLQMGDRILFYNGIAIEQVFEEFTNKEIGTNNPQTDQAFSEFFFTNRFGTRGFDIPQDDVEIIYSSSGQTKAFDVSWLHLPELIIEAPISNRSMSSSHTKKLCEKKHFKKSFASPYNQLFQRFYAADNEPLDLLGSRKSLIPELGPLLWSSEKDHEFHAYLFELDSRKIGGYIRIPSYESYNGANAALEFGKLIKVFQEVSDVLVIDQLNNGGGEIFYLYALLAMLTDRELDVPMHRIRITQREVYEAFKYNSYLESIPDDQTAQEKLGETIEGTVVNFRLVQSLINGYQFIINQWDQGKIYTDFYYVYGIEKIQPHPEIQYTKPILVLVNGLDLSAADYFPAILQDNGRALIMGTRTAGAGGYVEKISFPNLNGIEEISITASFSVRKNGKPIENFGVEPDIVYEVTEKDLKHNHVQYKEKILDELNRLVYPNKRTRKWKSR